MGKEKLTDLGIFDHYRLVHKGYVDVNKLIIALPKWFNSYEYDYWETGSGQKDIGTGKEYISDWKATREVNDYVKFEIKLQLFFKNINSVEIDGKKTLQCTIEIDLSSTMKKNYSKTFGKDKFQETLRRIYERYIRYHDLLAYEDKLAMETADLVNTMKSFFE